MQALLHQSNGSTVRLDSEIAAGGEGRIYSVHSDPNSVAKIYHNPTAEHANKLSAMIAQPPDDPTSSQGHISIAWPTERLLDTQGTCVGCLMPFIDFKHSIPLLKLYHPADRQQVAPSFTWEYLLRTATNLASTLDALHGRDYVVGDLNESNILVSTGALVTLVDCDSMQVPNGLGSPFRCKVGKPDYTPPELQGRDLSQVDRTTHHDDFGLAVLIFMLLMEGFHPFDGVWQGKGVNPTRQDRIRAGTWAYGSSAAHTVRPSPVALPFDTLPPQIQGLMKQCFDDGAGDPSRRPSASDWHTALSEAEQHLVHCRANYQHVYSQHLKKCPWCERIRTLGITDPFPQPGQQRSLPHVPHTIPRPTSYAPTGLPSMSTPTMPSIGYASGAAGGSYRPYAAAPGVVAGRSRARMPGFAIFATVLGVILVISLCAYSLSRGFAISSQGTDGTSSNRSGTTSTNFGAMVPVGQVIYHTSAPGSCDNQGGNWAQNSYAVQSCDADGLTLAGPNCPCPLGVVALSNAPGHSYPQNYVVQISAQLLSTGAADFFGFKFRQQNEQDSGQGRGGYAFLYALNGQWEFNRYDANGTRHILTQHTLSASAASPNTLDLVVNGSRFSFYMNGNLVSEQSDGTYSQGFLCLVAEPGANVLFRDMTLYSMS